MPIDEANETFCQFKVFGTSEFVDKKLFYENELDIELSIGRLGASDRFEQEAVICFRITREGVKWVRIVCLLVGCLTSQQHARASQGRICSDNITCCHTETEVAAQTFHLTQSQYTDTGPTSPRADPITPGAWQGIHWSANV